MCGLAGVVRRPDAPDFEKAKDIVTDLLYEIRDRGRHATGIAAITERQATVSKWAVDPAQVLPGDVWANTMAGFGDTTHTLIGHVRHATFANAKDDRAAHPYAVGPLVGAHNGIIRNWREFVPKTKKPTDFLTDSQAVFHALARAKGEPEKVLDRLVGDWALTWVRDGRLWLTRNEGRPLACAYVRDMRTLFWCSEIDKLARVLEGRYGMASTDYELWTPKQYVLYVLDPDNFDAEGSNPDRREYDRAKVAVTVKGGQGDVFGAAYGEDDYQGTDYGWRKGQGWGPVSRSTTTAKSEQERVADALDHYEPEYAKKGRKGGKKRKKQPGRGKAGDLSLRALLDRLEELEVRVESLEAENAWLTQQVSGQALEREGIPAPRSLKGERCYVCKMGEEYGPLVEVEDGPIHTDCIFDTGARA